MKITLPIALAAVLGLALAGIPITAHAQTTTTAAPATAPAPTTKAPKKPKYSGTLTAIDTAANTITITDKTVTPKTLSITPTTKIKKDGKMATLADFKIGDKVGGSYMTDATGKMEATSLNEGGKKAKKATKPAATTTPATTATPAAPAAQ